MFLQPVPYRRVFGMNVPGGHFHAPGIRVPLRSGSTVRMPASCEVLPSEDSDREMILRFGQPVDDSQLTVVVKNVKNMRLGARKKGSSLAETVNPFVDVQAFSAHVNRGDWIWLFDAPSPAWLISPDEAFRRLGITRVSPSWSRRRANFTRVSVGARREWGSREKLAAGLVLAGVAGLAFFRKA